MQIIKCPKCESINVNEVWFGCILPDDKPNAVWPGWPNIDAPLPNKVCMKCKHEFHT